MTPRKVYIATRGSALALAQATMIQRQCEAAFPNLSFELKVIKTTGDKLQTASMAREGSSLPKGLFTKELEVALLNGEADLAVHSLKDLPTELPTGLQLGAVGKREDVRDVLIYRDSAFSAPGRGRGFGPGLNLKDIPEGGVIATSSTRRKAQLLTLNAGLKLPDIRGNVATRMVKLASQPQMDATVLALAGMTRLKYQVDSRGHIAGKDVPEGLLAVVLSLEDMLPCVGQGAIGIETREDNELASEICQALDHSDTHVCVVAERSFLAAMGGGCQSPVAAYAEVSDGTLKMRAISFASGPARAASAERPLTDAVALGWEIASRLK